MMKYFLLTLTILFSCSVFSQTSGIQISKEGTQKVKFIKENKRIRVKTIDGNKFTGRFKVIDELNISIRGHKIPIKNIAKINRKPLLLSIAVDGFLITYGAFVVVIGALVGAILADTLVMLAVIPGAAAVYLGIKSPNLLKGYRKSKDWQYKLILVNK